MEDAGFDASLQFEDNLAANALLRLRLIFRRQFVKALTLVYHYNYNQSG